MEVTEKAWFKNVNASWQRLSYLQDQQFPITQAQWFSPVLCRIWFKECPTQVSLGDSAVVSEYETGRVLFSVY